MAQVHRQQVCTHARATPCLNLHALGEQWIGEVSDVDIVQAPQEDSHEGDLLIFKAQIRGWETDARRTRCRSLMEKSGHILRQALLRPVWKDILLIPKQWYPADSPKFETEGWWYAPAEEVLGRTCKSCRTFYEIENSAGTRRSRRNTMRCPKCRSENDQAGATGERGKQKNAKRKKAAQTPDASNLRRSERVHGQERLYDHGSSSESDSPDNSDNHEYDAQPCYGIKMRAADPRYITDGEDINRGDVLLTMTQVKELINIKAQSAAEIATIWLTTADMGFSLTTESNEVTCPKDAREGKVSDRFLAPAISRFATSVLEGDEQVEDLTQPINEARRRLASLHRRWSKIIKTSESENVRMQACKEAEKSNKFTRIVQRRDLPWEKDSIARAAYDPEHIPDCNVQATIGKHFLFHEVIPKAANGLGYLRVTTKSLWWQHEHFPNVWTSEGLTTCMENGYQWTINSTTWNHLRMMWLAVGAAEREEIKGREETVGREGAAEREHVEERGGAAEQEGKVGSNAATGREGVPGREEADEGVGATERKGTTGREGATKRGALDLLRHIYLESLFQDALEANGYRSPTWRILRALQAIINANVVIGESRLTAAPFFEGAGRPSGPFWGPQQGRRVILWESLSLEDQQKCLNDLQDDTEWVIWCKAKPKDMATQAFRAYGQCIFEGKREKPKQAKGTQEDVSGGKHVVRARSWWKRGDVSACAVQTHMQCWVHRDTIVDEGQVEMKMREAWEHEHSKDETNIDLRGLERHYWNGTEAGCLGCYDFPGETWAGDGSVHKGAMGAGSICLQRPTCILVVRVGREEEGVSSLRSELAAMARTLQAAPAESDLIYLCDSEAALNKISRWIGSGPRTTLAGDANADIMISIIERVRERVQKGARTFMIKVKAHRGEPLNELADTQAENARQLQDECRQWTVRTPSMTYEWSDSNGVKQTTAWSKAVRKAMVRGGAEYQVQEAMNHAVINWSKTFLRDTNAGLHSIGQAASMGVQGDLMSNERWGRECMLQLQEDENWNKPTTTTWAAEFLLREGESREFLGSWIRSGKVPEAKKRRAKQVITCSFPCGQWLHMIGARASPRCELCRRERETRRASIDSLPPETVAHIQSAGCNLQKKSVIGAHNRCWKYLIGAISTHGEAKRSLEVLGGDKDRQLHTLWKETKIGEILPWDDTEEEAEELIARRRVERRASASNQANQQREDEQGGDEKDPSEEVIFGQRRPDSLAIDWTNKMVYVLEFKRTSDQRRDYREKGESRARVQHDVLIRSLEKVAGETESEGERWKVKLIVFVGGTCGSVHVQTFNNNLKELGVVESKRGAIRKGLVQELLHAQDTVLCSYFAQREGATNGDKGRRSTAAEVFQGLDKFG
jgi:ribonuclease HI